MTISIFNFIFGVDDILSTEQTNHCSTTVKDKNKLVFFLMLYKDNHADRIVLTSFPPTGIEPTLVLKKKKKINEGDSVAISLGI